MKQLVKNKAHIYNEDQNDEGHEFKAHFVTEFHVRDEVGEHNQAVVA
jgi:hypothetical protein